MTSPYDMSPIEFRASSSSSSLNFAPSVDMHGLDSSDTISQLMHNSYDLGPFEAAPEPARSRRKSNRNRHILDGDLSPPQSALESNSPLSKFPPVPTTLHGDWTSHKGAKLLRKTSAQNLPQRSSATSVSSSASAADDLNGHGIAGGKTPRKQRSFHASRVPLPPLPGFRSSSGSNQPTASVEAPTQPSSPSMEPRRSSVTSPRKRLFSGSSARRSTSSHGPTSPSEDDKRSIFSFESDIRPATASGIEGITMSFGAAGGPLSLMTKNACISPSSFWDEHHSPVGDGQRNGDKRASQTDYTPQYIMAPAEQLKLAEKLEDEDVAAVREPEPEPDADAARKPKLDLHPGDFGMTFTGAPAAVRSRTNSVLSSRPSTGTPAGAAPGEKNGGGVSRGASILSQKSSILSPGAHHPPPRPYPTSTSTAAMAMGPPPLKVTIADSVAARNGGGPSRSASMLAKGSSKPAPLSVRPSTANGSLSLTPPATPGYPVSSHSPDMPNASLPPPPRRRPSRSDLHELDLPAAMAASAVAATAAKRMSVVPINPLSPPPVRGVRHRQDSTGGSSIASSRPPSAFDRQKIMKRRSLMKKPSFLDIDDEDVGGAASDSDDGRAPESPSMDSSFLDMDRGKGSFDTIRSVDSGFY